MEAFIFVWIAGVTGKVSAFLSFVGLATLFLTLVVYTFKYINWADSYKSVIDNKPSFKFHLKIMVAGFILALLGMLLPSERTMYLAGAAWMGQKVVQSETSDKVVRILNSKLDEYLKEAEEKINRVKEN